jgi:hypothetical protein
VRAAGILGPRVEPGTLRDDHGNDEVGMLEDGAEHVVADPSDPSGFDTVDASPLSAGRRFGPVTGAFGIRLDAQQSRSVLTSEEGQR